jgi:Tol biopolymer transport system component
MITASHRSRSLRRLALETLEERRMLSVDLSSSLLTTVPGNAASYQPALSADGRYAAFASAADNLVAGDTNGAGDVFVKDLQTGAIQRVSTSSTGTAANAASSDPHLSADGRYVTFASDATNLVPLDLNNSSDVFVKDLQSGILVLASSDALGAGAGGASYDPSLSPDGRYVAFTSAAEDLVNGDTNSDVDVFVKDLASGTVTLVSIDATGAQTDDDSSHAALSTDGRFVAFESRATNLVDGDTNEVCDVFLKDLLTGAIARVSVDYAGAQGVGSSYDASLSADGRHVAFLSDAGNLVPIDTNALCDVFVKDMQTGAIFRASTDSNGNQANRSVSTATLSGDGRHVAFITSATNLVADDTNGVDDVFVKDLDTGCLTRVNTNAQGQQTSGVSWSTGSPSLSSDGRYVAFASAADNLTTDDDNAVTDVFVKDRRTAAVALVSSTAPHDATPGLYDPNTSLWYLANTLGSGPADVSLGFGVPGAGWKPIVGDWNGDGVDTVGLYDPIASVFYLRNSNTSGPADLTVAFGLPAGGWTPVVGDWNGDAIDTVGLYDPNASLFYLRNTNSTGAADVVTAFGPPGAGWTPLAGDWNGDGCDSVGLYDSTASSWYLTDALAAGTTDHVRSFGPPNAGWLPVVGDWNADQVDTPALFDATNAVWYLACVHASQSATTLAFGTPGAGWLPVAGDWDGLVNSVALSAAAVDQVDLAQLTDEALEALTPA